MITGGDALGDRIMSEWARNSHAADCRQGMPCTISCLEIGHVRLTSRADWRQEAQKRWPQGHIVTSRASEKQTGHSNSFITSSLGVGWNRALGHPPGIVVGWVGGGSEGGGRWERGVDRTVARGRDVAMEWNLRWLDDDEKCSPRAAVRDGEPQYQRSGLVVKNRAVGR